MTKITDQHYIDQIMAGNTNAFAVLVDRYKDLVFTLALKTLKNREEAEEVAQDSFIKVYKSIGKFKGESKFSTWLYKVTYNTCLDRLKRNKKESNVVPIDEFNERQLAVIESALHSIDEKERNQTIQDCLQELPGEDSFLLTLYYFEEQSLEEISKIIGIKTNHIKVKLYRSRKKLAVILKKRLEPEIIEDYERERR